MKLFTFPNVFFSTLAIIVLLDQLGYMSRHGCAWKLVDAPLAFVPFPDEFIHNVWFVVYGILLIPLVHLWRWFIKYRIAAPIANSFAGLYAPSLKFEKFLENFWLALHYAYTVSAEVYVMSHMSFWPPMLTHESRIAISPPYEFMMDEQRTNTGIQAIYLLQFSFYFLELITLITQRKTQRRSDFYVYFFHHVYTVVLLSVSWITVNQRLGLLVLLFHDVGDIFLPSKHYTLDTSLNLTR